MFCPSSFPHVNCKQKEMEEETNRIKSRGFWRFFLQKSSQIYAQQARSQSLHQAVTRCDLPALAPRRVASRACIFPGDFPWPGWSALHRWFQILKTIWAGRINLPIRWMEEILHQFIGGLSHYFQAFYHPRWCRIPSIHSITLRDLWIRVISRLHPIKVMMKPIINPNYQWVMKFGTKSSTASHIPLIFLYCNNNHS